MKKPNKTAVIVAAVMTLVVWLFNILPPFFTSLHLWPMFLASIFFFLLAHGDIKKIPTIIASIIAGIVISGLMFIAIGAATPALGDTYPTWIFLGIALAIIIVGGTMWPFVLNNVTFGCLIMACAELISLMHIDALEAAMGLPGHQPFNLVTECGIWILIALIGGSIMCLVCGLVMQAVIKGLKKSAEKKTADQA